MHHLYAALLGQFALFQTHYCMEQVVQSQISTMARNKNTHLQNFVKSKLKILPYKPEVQKTDLIYVYGPHENSHAGHAFICHNLRIHGSL